MLGGVSRCGSAIVIAARWWEHGSRNGAASMDLETVMSPGAGMNRNGAASKVGERRPLPADISFENRCCTSFLFLTCM